jgi:hypothetical protein
LKFNQPFEKRPARGTGIMQREVSRQTAIVKFEAPQQVAPRHGWPLLGRFAAKLVIDVLPAAFVSVLGGFIITQYQLSHTSALRPATAQVVPASAEMMQLVRDEHAVLVDYLKTQMAMEKNRHAAEDAAVADARLAAVEMQAPAAALAAVAIQRPVATAVAAKLVPARAKVAVTPVLPPHAPLAIAQADQTVSRVAAPAPESKSLLTRTIEIKDHVVGVTLHAVSAIGSIPSWIASMGDRIGGADTTSSSTGRSFATSS